MNATQGGANLLPGAILHPGVNLHQGANCAYKRGFSVLIHIWIKGEVGAVEPV